MKSELELIRHQGKYVAFNSAMEVIATDFSQEKARSKAICKGVTCPIILYARYLKPDLRTEIAMTKVALNAIQKVSKMPGIKSAYEETIVSEIETKLHILLGRLEKSGRDLTTQKLVDQLEDEIRQQKN